MFCRRQQPKLGLIVVSFEKNLKASRPSEHPTQTGGGNVKTLGGIIGCKDKTYSCLNGFPSAVVVTLGQQYNGEKPTVILCVCVFFPFILDIKFVGRTSRGHTGGRCTYINRHAGTQTSPCRDTNKNIVLVVHTTTKTNRRQCSTYLDRIVIIYDNSAIAPAAPVVQR